MSTTCTQKQKPKIQNPKPKTQTTNPPLHYSTPALNRPTVSNTPTPQPCYINAIHEYNQHGLSCRHYSDNGNLIGPLPDPIQACQTLMPVNRSPGLSTCVNKGKGWEVSLDPGPPNNSDPPDDHHSSDNDQGHSCSPTPWHSGRTLRTILMMDPLATTVIMTLKTPTQTMTLRPRPYTKKS